MSILAINPGHNGSVAYLNSEGQTVFYCEEERLSRQKRDGNPFRAMLHVLLNYPVTDLIIGGTTNNLPQLPWTNENPYAALARKFNPNIQITLMGHEHHLGHAANAFYGSGYDSAVAIVVDGAGSLVETTYEDPVTKALSAVSGYETESIYKCSYPHTIELVHKNLFMISEIGQPTHLDLAPFCYDNSVSITKAYEAATAYLGFGFIEAGKTMGLAPYGRNDSNIPDFFTNGYGNKNFLLPFYPAGAFIDEARYPYFAKTNNEWHWDKNQATDVQKNLAWKVQQQTQERVGDLIQRAIDITGETNVVLSGGYALNCMANYYFLNRFPTINIFVDPLAHDGGTALGLAKLHYYVKTQSTESTPLTTVYLGAPQNYNNLDFIVEQVPSISLSNTTASDVAGLIADGEIVALFRSQSEGGPRALGNRSILFDPRNPNGKDIVNRVKNREWFRPFAASVMLEHAEEWFEMRGLPESQFMMYAMNVVADKMGTIPAVTHVDGTCRIQTVSQEQNPDFYNIIAEFKAKTGCPMLLNTSFNLAGEPLVETVEDAIGTVLRSEIRYLWLPDLGKLIVKQNSEQNQ